MTQLIISNVLIAGSAIGFSWWLGHADAILPTFGACLLTIGLVRKFQEGCNAK